MGKSFNTRLAYKSFTCRIHDLLLSSLPYSQLTTTSTINLLVDTHSGNMSTIKPVFWNNFCDNYEKRELARKWRSSWKCRPSWKLGMPFQITSQGRGKIWEGKSPDKLSTNERLVLYRCQDPYTISLNVLLITGSISNLYHVMPLTIAPPPPNTCLICIHNFGVLFQVLFISRTTLVQFNINRYSCTTETIFIMERS